MIVKNEAHIIQETLNDVYRYIDYYIISDTGSTDNTIQVIKDFFDSKNIKGEIHQNEWKNFGYNRTVGLELCKDKAEYIWVIDADDIIVGNFVLPILENDSYELTYGQGFTYKRLQIFKESLKWRYVGVVHEYPDCSKPNYSKTHIKGDYYIDSRRMGDRSKDPKKYLRDALLLEEALKDEPNNERYMFYLAQSYFDYGDTEKGIDCYNKRIKMGGFYEEVFYSYLRVGSGMQMLNKPWKDIEQLYLQAYNFCNLRGPEALYEIVKHYRLERDFKTSYKWAKIAAAIPYPKNCDLFIFKEIYDYKLLEELALDAFYLGEYGESLQVYRKILKSTEIPSDERTRLEKSLMMVQNVLKDSERMVCVLYTKGRIVGENDKLWQLLRSIKDCYKIFIIGDGIVYRDSYTYIKMEHFAALASNVTINLVMVYDSLNVCQKDIDVFKNYPLVLYQNNNKFKLYTNNHLQINLTNEYLLNLYLSKFSKIISDDPDVYNTLINNCKVNKEALLLYDYTNANCFADKTNS